MKDELKGIAAIEFVGLRSKMYSMKCGDDKLDKKTCKGIKKSVVDKEISHKEYVEAVKNQKIYHNTMNTFRSYKHELYTIQMNKVSLCSFNDKRYVLNNGFETRAHGHYKNLK